MIKSLLFGLSQPGAPLFYVFKKIYFIYLFDGEKAQVGRVGGRGRGNSRLSAERGALPRTQSQDPEIMT